MVAYIPGVTNGTQRPSRFRKRAAHYELQMTATRIQQGASVFGVMDLVGNVWQWTDEYGDEHTRAAILRGGSYYQPQGCRLVLPASVPQRPAWKASADGTQQRSSGHAGISLCCRRGDGAMRC
jgi:formylglycine-generating enzyme required for sulfatase activity